MIRYVNQGECILIRSQYKHCEAFGEAIIQRVREGLPEALKGLLDKDTVQVLLFDPSTLKAEDITEEAAKVFLDGWNGDPDEDEVPAFVKGSDAFEAWAEEQRVERGFNDRRHHTTYSTMNGGVA